MGEGGRGWGEVEFKKFKVFPSCHPPLVVDVDAGYLNVKAGEESVNILAPLVTPD